MDKIIVPDMSAINQSLKGLVEFLKNPPKVEMPSAVIPESHQGSFEDIESPFEQSNRAIFLLNCLCQALLNAFPPEVRASILEDYERLISSRSLSQVDDQK